MQHERTLNVILTVTTILAVVALFYVFRIGFGPARPAPVKPASGGQVTR